MFGIILKQLWNKLGTNMPPPTNVSDIDRPEDFQAMQIEFDQFSMKFDSLSKELD